MAQQKVRFLTDAERNAEIAARNGADSGTGNYDTLLITGNNLKGKEWGGDTFDTVYEAWNKANPGAMSKGTFRDWFIKNNHSLIINVKDCEGRANVAPNVRIGEVVKLPEGKEITQLDWKWACPPQTDPIIERPATPPVQPSVESLTNTDPERLAQVLMARNNNLKDKNALGNQSELQDAVNLGFFATDFKPKQPVVAAMGPNLSNAAGPQTAAGMVGTAIEWGAMSPFGTGAVTISLVGLSTRVNVNGRSIDDRQTSTAERNGFDVLWVKPSKQTRINGTLLPGLGIQFENGRVTDAADHFDNDQFMQNVENGVYVAAGMTSKKAQDSDYIKQNKIFLQATASNPQLLLGTSNYSLAAQVNDQIITPHIASLNAELKQAAEVDKDAGRTKAIAQEMVGLMNFQQTLTGVSNYDVNANVSAKISPEQAAKLNVRESIVHNRSLVAEYAAQHGVTGLDINAVHQDPVRSLTKEQVTKKMIEYWTPVAQHHEEAFKKIYSEAINEKAPRKLDEKTVEHFVDNLPVMKTFPEKGFSYKHLEHLYTSPESSMSRVELRQWEPKTTPAQEERKAAVDKAISAVFSGEAGFENTKTYLENVGNKAALAVRDNLSIQSPAAFGGVALTRDKAQNEVAGLGYGKALMETTFTKGQTNGFVKNQAQVQQVLADSANSDEIVAKRQKQILELTKHGKAKGLEAGAIGTMFLNELVTDDKTLKAFEATLREKDPANAEATIELLKQGVKAARDIVTTKVTGKDVDTNISIIRKQEAVSTLESLGGFTKKEVTQKEIEVPAAATALTSQFAKYPQVATTFLAETAKTADSASAALSAPLHGAAAVTVARAVLSDSKGAHAASALLAPEDKKRFDAIAKAPASLKEADAKFVVGAFAENTTLAPMALNRIAANKDASAALTKAIAADDKTSMSVIGHLSGNQREAIAAKGKFDAGLFNNIKQTTTHTTEITTNFGDIGEHLQKARTMPAGPARDAQTATAFFENEKGNNAATQKTALDSLQKLNPAYTNALIIKTLADNPDLRKQVVSDLKDKGTAGELFPSLLNLHSEGKLSKIVNNLSAAYAANNTVAIEKYAAEMNAFAQSADPALGTRDAKFNDRALKNLYAATMEAQTPKGGISGQQALGETAVHTIQATLTEANPLPTIVAPGNETLSLFSVAGSKADVTNAKTNLAQTQKHVENMYTLDGWIVPFVGSLNKQSHAPQSKPNDPPVIIDTPVGCGGVNRPCVTPPVTPPVVNVVKAPGVLR